MQWYKLTPEQIQKLKEFQRIMGYLYDLYYNKGTHTKEKLIQFEQLISNDLGMFPFLGRMDEQIKRVLTEINKINPERMKQVNQQLLDSQGQFGDFFDNLEQGIVTDFNIDDINTLLEESKATARPIKDIVNSYLINYIEKSGASLFFSGGKKTGLLTDFGQKDWQELINKPIPKYSYLKFIDNGTPETYIYFINKLSDKGSKIDLHPETFKEYLDFEYDGNSQWKELKKLVDEYQHNNNIDILKKALKLMVKFKPLVDYHNKLKAKYSRLYRGLGSNEFMDDSEITKEEKNRGIVATTTSYRAAENFAYGRGHLMGNVQSNDFAYMITYSVQPRDILLDTRLFGELYGEEEIVINSRTATIKEIEQLPDIEETKEYEDDDYED